MMLAWKMGPLLAAGNTVVLKPAQASCLCLLLLFLFLLRRKPYNLPTFTHVHQHIGSHSTTKYKCPLIYSTPTISQLLFPKQLHFHIHTITVFTTQYSCFFVTGMNTNTHLSVLFLLLRGVSVTPEHSK